jgi:hypothetical protein
MGPADPRAYPLGKYPGAPYGGYLGLGSPYGLYGGYYGYAGSPYGVLPGYGLYGGLYGGFYGGYLVQPPDLSRVIWTSPGLGYDPFAGFGVAVDPAVPSFGYPSPFQGWLGIPYIEMFHLPISFTTGINYNPVYNSFGSWAGGASYNPIAGSFVGWNADWW